MRKKKLTKIIILSMLLIAVAGGCKGRSLAKLSSPEDINLKTDDDSIYAFDYDGEKFFAVFYIDTWEIHNSYRITDHDDIVTICRALSQEHPVPSKDRTSYRTPEDMAYEWEQHNLVYEQLPEDSHWKSDAKNVDLDPDDQGKTIKEIYEDRTGKKITLDTIIEKINSYRRRKGITKSRIKEKIKEFLK